jgi:hypothetical protein
VTGGDDTHDGPGGDLGERLASWLEDLGLVPHLAAAGLPRLDRDDAGRARWTDPGTGAPLTVDQLHQLDRLLHAEGSDPRHAVPVPLVQVARRARVREELLAGPWHSYETLAALRGASVDGTRFAVHKAAAAHLLLVVAEGERALVPAFQLTSTGDPRPDLAPVLAPLLSARTDPWLAWAWLTRPSALLGGLVPERAVTDPGTAELVLHAAVRLAERVTAGAGRPTA